MTTEDAPFELPPAWPDVPTTEGPARAGPDGGERMRLRLGDPAEVVAALPHLLGFVPVESLVLVALRHEAGRSEVGAVVRIDLPQARHEPAAVSACMRRLGRRAPDDVVLVVIGGGGPGDEDDAPPRGALVALVEESFAAVRVPVRTRLWVARIEAGAPWCCYPPCECRGVVPDPRGSAAAMATTVLGHVTYGSRDELAAVVAPDPEAGSARRRRLIDEAVTAAVLDRELGGPAAARRDLDAVLAAAREVGRGEPLGDTEVARLAVALSDPRVRDVCVGWALGEGPVTTAAAERLWTLLTRATPAPEVAEPATLLACAVLLRGGGALVGAALERAWAADPDHTLSRLVAALLERGIEPEDTREWVRAASSEAAQQLDGAGPGAGAARRRGAGAPPGVGAGAAGSDGAAGRGVPRQRRRQRRR